MTDLASHRSRSGKPSLLACTECRKKHLKCDSTLPICLRCATDSLRCSYTPSRRGYKGPSKRRSGVHPSAPADGVTHSRNQSSNNSGVLQQIHTATSRAPSTSTDTSGPSFGDDHNELKINPTVDVDTSQLRLQSLFTLRQSSSSLQSDDEHLIDLFYANFHPAHPVLVPRSYYNAQAYPQFLKLVVQFIGSNYMPSLSTDSLRASTTLELTRGLEKTVYMVQALLLHAIALHGKGEAGEAQTILTQAVDLAIELGINQREFASDHGMQDAVLEESLRRTWWELYVVDGYMAAIHRQTGFRSSTVNLHALLPCEESTYTDGICIPSPCSLDFFDARFFADEELIFSSFCYRIEAVRIIARVLATASLDGAHNDEVQSVDNALAGWIHHLPIAKADIISNDGEIDQMILQAHFMIQCASIFLHFRRSDLLVALPATAEIVCAQNVAQISPTSAYHTVKAIEASKELSDIAALPIPVLKHTPFFVCGLVLSCIVQLSACSVRERSRLQQYRDRVVLMTGVLRSLSSTWAISQYVLQQLKKVANEVFSTRFESTVRQSSSSRDSGIDMSGWGSESSDVSWLDFLCTGGLQDIVYFDSEPT